MIIKIQELQNKIEEIKNEYSLSNKDISDIMEIDYTYIFRIFKYNTKPGKKVIEGIEKLCKRFNLDSSDYIFLE